LHSPPLYTLLRSFDQCFRDHRDLHSFPTRRSSDLTPFPAQTRTAPVSPALHLSCMQYAAALDPGMEQAPWGTVFAFKRTSTLARSEEHTSELQSRENLVCRLLLEKKKNNTCRHHQY